MRKFKFASIVVILVMILMMFSINNTVLAEEEDNITEIGTAINLVSIAGWAYGTTTEGVDVVYVVSVVYSAVFNAIDPSTRKVINSLPIEGVKNGWGITVAPNGDVYVASDTNGSLFKYDPIQQEIENLGKVTDDARTIWDLVADDEGR